MIPETGSAMPKRQASPVEDGDIRGAAARLIPPVLTVGVFFFCFHLWRVGDVNITLSDLLFVTVIFLELGLSRLNGMPFGALTPLWLASLVVMLTGLMLGSFFHGDMTRWLIVAAQYLFSYMLLPMVLIRDRATLRPLIITLIVAMVAMESVGIAGYYFLSGYEQATAIFGRDFITGGRRLGAMVGDANWNSAVIAMTLPFVMYAASQRMISSAAALIAATVLLWAIMLAASFTGFCAAMMAMGAMAVAGRMYPSPKLLVLAALLVAGLFASGYQMPDIFAKRVAPALQEGSLDSAGTYDDRADLIVEAWKHAEHTAIIGMGVDEYRKFSSFGQPVHNMYMLELAEGGILALAGWLGIVGMLILIPLTRLARHRLEASLCLAVIMVFLIFTIASPHMYARLWMVPVLLSLGIVVTAGDPLPLLSGRITRNRPRGTGQMY